MREENRVQLMCKDVEQGGPYQSTFLGKDLGSNTENFMESVYYP